MGVGWTLFRAFRSFLLVDNRPIRHYRCQFYPIARMSEGSRRSAVVRRGHGVASTLAVGGRARGGATGPRSRNVSAVGCRWPFGGRPARPVKAPGTRGTAGRTGARTGPTGRARSSRRSRRRRSTRGGRSERIRSYVICWADRQLGLALLLDPTTYQKMSITSQRTYAGTDPWCSRDGRMPPVVGGGVAGTPGHGNVGSGTAGPSPHAPGRTGRPTDGRRVDGR